ncbi:MAG TPA: KUP/HAK/KT family potassium transporter, partial [Rhodocyclaceae bacterium]|nr:KUP/HAK/KT family potassium transporter [Rhodocyclaceae bacterium]HWU84089.1 KUP/HAK/KT family potassium transporter [Rhodocyclaceae bacterium]
VFTLLSTWRAGRALLLKRLRQDAMPLDAFLDSLDYGGPHRIEGTGIYMTPNPDGVPRAMLHNLLHNKVLHERIVMLSVQMEDVPHVPEIDRVEVRMLKHGFSSVIVRFGFKDDPDVPAALGMCNQHGIAYEPMETSFFLARETIIPSKKVRGMPLWREILFKWMFRNADPATAFFKIPPNRVVELGSQIEM